MMQSKFAEIIEFIKSRFSESDDFIPLHAPVFKGNEKKYLEECIDSTFVSSVGKFVDRFESDVAKYTGTKQAVVCVNGTNALHLALLMLGVSGGDEVITQPLTFVATVNAISYCGANPVFVDVDEDNLGLSPKALLKFLETNTEQKLGGCYNKETQRKISACVPMHTFGNPCRIDEIVELCKAYGIAVVEDAAESLGSFYKGRHTGTFGQIGVLSFNGNKIITTGGGGMLLFNNVELAEKAKHLTTQAKVPHPWEFIHDEIGYNYRMPNINAALGVAQLERINTYLLAKRELAQEYLDYFSSINVPFLTEIKDARSNYWLNAIWLDNKQQRDEFLKYTNTNGVMTRPVWRLMNELPMFKECYSDGVQNALKLSEKIVNIPSSVRLQ